MKRQQPSSANSSSQANLIETEDYKKLHIQKNIQSLIQKVFSFIASKKKIIVLLGAGVSVDSGIPDFRSKNGFFNLVKNKIPSYYSPEDVFDLKVFKEDPSLFYSTIQYIYFQNPSSSPIHKWLQTLPIQHLYTQNIDGLESCLTCPITYLHGTLSSGTCQSCKKKMNQEQLSEYYKNGRIARCECEGIIKPDILFYGDILQSTILEEMKEEAKICDLLLILGTSLSTYPVSQCIEYFSNCDMVVLNQTNINISYRNDSYYTIQLLGSFKELLKYNKNEKEEEINDLPKGKTIIISDSGNFQKRKYVQYWNVL